MSQQEKAPARPLYDRVEEIRLANAWTRVQLARTAGVSRGTIDNWKTQPRAPLAPTVIDVADRLGIGREEALALAGITRPALEVIEGGSGSSPPDEFGLGPEPPFPDAPDSTNLDSGQILNRAWQVAKDLEAIYYKQHGTQSERQLRVIRQYELATEALIEELGGSS